MIENDTLRKYARLLMFEMAEEQYDTLQEEFDIMLKQMDLIEKIPNISDVEPMTFPFTNKDVELREDEVGEYLTTSEVLENSKHQVNDQVKVPRVVEEGE